MSEVAAALGASGAPAAPGGSGAFDAVVLAGGRGRRLGGVDKAGLRLHGERLVDRAVGAARDAGARRVIVVGPESTGSPRTIVVREDPPFTGPLAALAAALPQVDADLLLLLSCDLVRPARVCELLRAQRPGPGLDGTVLRDADGRAQWLAGLYRVTALREGILGLDGATDHAPLRAILDPDRLAWIDAPPDTTADIDAPEDLARARRDESGPRRGAGAGADHGTDADPDTELTTDPHPDSDTESHPTDQEAP